MSTTVTFAGNWTGDPKLLHTRDGNPFVACQVLVTCCIQKEAGEWLDGESTGHSVTICGTAANHFYVSAGRGDRVAMHGQLRSYAATPGAMVRPARRASSRTPSSTTAWARLAPH